jgi:hypothetical protein
MKNPPDLLQLAFASIASLMSFATASLFLSGIEEWINGENNIKYSFLVVACISFGVAFIVLSILMQVIYRPRDVDVGDYLLLHWRYRRTETIPLEYIADMVIDPKAPSSYRTRWTAGSIGLKEKRLRLGCTYEIMRAVQKKYFDKFGRDPHSPSWYKGK